MERNEIEALIQKYLDGTCSPEEKQLFEQLYIRVYQAKEPYPPRENLEKVRDKIYDRLMDTKKHPAKRWRHAAVAAVLLIALTTALYFYPVLNVNHPSSIVHEIGPGGNRATLTLSNGQTISLDSAQSGIIVSSESIKYNDGTSVPAVILTEAGGSHRPETRSTPLHPVQRDELLQLSTPKGGQYQVILSDGSKVWLNTASTLTYPSRFSDTERTVEISGEAYFEIKENRTKPFKVISKNQEILVLGTSFNVTTYEDEKEQKTTLASGAVQVITKNGASVKLVTNEQSTLQNNGKLTKAKADISSATSWREGAFTFTNKPFAAIMREVARWYDIAVVYQAAVPQVQLYGSINRSNNLSVLLALLQASEITYQLNGRTLTITSAPTTQGGKP